MNISEALKQLLSWFQSLVKRPSKYVPTEISVRKRTAQLLDYYNGTQLSYLNDVLSAQFYNAVSLKLQPEISNVVKYITDSLCKTFKNGLLVNAEIPTEQAIYDKIFDDVQLEAFVKDLEKKVFVCKTVFVKVSWLEQEQKIHLSLITPQYTVVEPEVENPTRIKSIIYPVSISPVIVPQNFSAVTLPPGIFAYWTINEFKIVNEKGVVLPNDGNVEGVNPYGVIPVVVFREQYPTNNEFWQWPGEELISGQDAINVKLTELNQLIKMQSFSVPVLTNPSQDVYGNVDLNIDPSKPIVFKNVDKDNPSKFEYVTPSARITEVQDAIDKSYIKTFGMYGLSADDFISSKERRSADGIKQSNIKVDEYRDEMRRVYASTLVELFDVIRVVWNTHNTEQLQGGVTIEIVDSSLRYVSETEKWLDYQRKLDYDLITPVDIMVLENDDLTPQEALERIQTNAQLNAQLGVSEDSNESTEQTETTEDQPPVPQT